MHARRPREIRQFIQQRFAELSPTAGSIVDETLLIRDGQYCGHRYRATDLTAVWFLEENEIKFYDQAGHVIGIVCPDEATFNPRTDAA